MEKKHQILLIIDGSINLALGILLLLFPFGTAGALGIPRSSMWDHEGRCLFICF
jgi:hypothetical protein